MESTNKTENKQNHLSSEVELFFRCKDLVIPQSLTISQIEEFEPAPQKYPNSQILLYRLKSHQEDPELVGKTEIRHMTRNPKYAKSSIITVNLSEPSPVALLVLNFKDSEVQGIGRGGRARGNSSLLRSDLSFLDGLEETNCELIGETWLDLRSILGKGSYGYQRKLKNKNSTTGKVIIEYREMPISLQLSRKGTESSKRSGASSNAQSQLESSGMTDSTGNQFIRSKENSIAVSEGVSSQSNTLENSDLVGLGTEYDHYFVKIIARNVKNVEFFSKSDPFLMFYKPVRSKDREGIDTSTYSRKEPKRVLTKWRLVKKTEYHKDNLNPEFQSFIISRQAFNDDNEDEAIKVEIWDHSKRGKHQKISQGKFTTRDLLSQTKPVISTYSDNLKSNYGDLVFLSFFRIEKPSFLKLVEINCMAITTQIAIDFSLANGSKQYSTSFHYISETGKEFNNYEKLIYFIGNQLSHFARTRTDLMREYQQGRRKGFKNALQQKLGLFKSWSSDKGGKPLSSHFANNAGFGVGNSAVVMNQRIRKKKNGKYLYRFSGNVVMSGFGGKHPIIKKYPQVFTQDYFEFPTRLKTKTNTKVVYAVPDFAEIERSYTQEPKFNCPQIPEEREEIFVRNRSGTFSSYTQEFDPGNSLISSLSKSNPSAIQRNGRKLIQLYRSVLSEVKMKQHRRFAPTLEKVFKKVRQQLPLIFLRSYRAVFLLSSGRCEDLADCLKLLKDFDMDSLPLSLFVLVVKNSGMNETDVGAMRRTRKWSDSFEGMHERVRVLVLEEYEDEEGEMNFKALIEHIMQVIPEDVMGFYERFNQVWW